MLAITEETQSGGNCRSVTGFSVASGELTSEMIQEYLDHHFEVKVDDHLRTEE